MLFAFGTHQGFHACRLTHLRKSFRQSHSQASVALKSAHFWSTQRHQRSRLEDARATTLYAEGREFVADALRVVRFSLADF